MPEAEGEKGGGVQVGEYLRSVRQSRGVELDDASKVTKIGKNYLAAIEEGEFDKLPSAAYIKGFLRLYADFLGLSGDEVVARYEESQGAAPVRPPVEPARERPHVEIMERSKVGGPSRWIIPVLLLVLVIITAYFFSEGEQKPVRRAAPPPAPAPSAPAPAPAPQPTAAVLPPRSSAASAPAAAPKAQPAAASVQPEAQAPAIPPVERRPGGIVLRLRFNRDTWLSITIDDSVSQRYDLKAGDVIEWKGTKAFVVDVGDGGAVGGEFNGRPLKSLGEAGSPAHVELKAP